MIKTRGRRSSLLRSAVDQERLGRQLGGKKDCAAKDPLHQPEGGSGRGDLG